jgi:hypothetical protein
MIAPRSRIESESQRVSGVQKIQTVQLADLAQIPNTVEKKMPFLHGAPAWNGEKEGS